MMLELNFTQTLGSHTLTLNETLPASGITAIFWRVRGGENVSD
ncbi:Molybdenum transport ATP-binding protein ModC (TC 3.A.1.8.1) [Enterobacter hormaechei]|nr:Molybdenum transport ATP-binding protein ModC (TC 3.A.1.8.1) [Enterobacter hormaechei]